MKRYIDADALLEEINEAFPILTIFNNIEAVSIRERLYTFPTADVVEVRHGEWQYEQLDEYKFYKVTCPYCGAYYMGNYDAYHDPDDFNFCPNCGAKMDGERREDNAKN